MTLDVIKDFEPICLYTVGSIFLAVNRDSKFKTTDDLIDFAKKNPGKISCAIPGIGSNGHFALEILNASANVSLRSVPFKSDGDTVIALMGGHVDSATTNMVVASGKLASGDIRALASFDENRLPPLKDVPTFKEKGYPEVVISIWLSFVAPAGTPKEIIEKLNKAMRVVIEDPALALSVDKFGWSIDYKGPEDLRKLIKSQLDKFKKIAKEQNISLK